MGGDDLRAGRKTGESRPAYVFVAVLGASSYTYAEATWTRGLPDWIGSHTRTLLFFGGATRIIVPGQWKAGVNKPCYWEPELNRTYQEWAIHNGVAIVPARPGRARDKAKVEQGGISSPALDSGSLAQTPVLQPGPVERSD